jgi:hypothetical protein
VSDHWAVVTEDGQPLFFIAKTPSSAEVRQDFYGLNHKDTKITKGTKVIRGLPFADHTTGGRKKLFRFMASYLSQC